MKKMIQFHNIQIVLNQQFFLITKVARKKKDTLDTNGKDEDEDNFHIYHSKQCEPKLPKLC